MVGEPASCQVWLRAGRAGNSVRNGAPRGSRNPLQNSLMPACLRLVPAARSAMITSRFDGGQSSPVTHRSAQMRYPRRTTASGLGGRGLDVLRIVAAAVGWSAIRDSTGDVESPSRYTP